MSTSNIFESAVQTYSRVIVGENTALTLDDVIGLIDAARMYLALASQKESSGEIDKNEALKIRVHLRNRAKSLLNMSELLDGEARRNLSAFILELPEYLPGKLKITEDYFSSNIESWSRDLACFAHRPCLNFLEVGSFEGLSACWLLENILTHDSCVLTAIDTFDFAGQGVVHLQDVGLESMSIEERFDFNLEQTGAKHRVKKIVGYSHVILRSLPFSNYDYIYIDGSHKAANVLEDAVLAWPLLKKGGLLTFDDYEWDHDPNPINRPKIAIDSFLAVFEAGYRLIRKDYQVTIEKLSD
ncbi:MAG TPA: class I SAM-dependent methyltransferase [Blastocatellia bacterium]|nr:class I SAM-dependent methyltransferase [Blastocatellia bacterium]